MIPINSEEEKGATGLYLLVYKDIPFLASQVFYQDQMDGRHLPTELLHRDHLHAAARLAHTLLSHSTYPTFTSGNIQAAKSIRS